jgi:hypothetical protein
MQMKRCRRFRVALVILALCSVAALTATDVVRFGEYLLRQTSFIRCASAQGRPYTSLLVSSDGEGWIMLPDVLLDSGADHSFFPGWVAEALGIDLSQCPQGTPSGVGGTTTAYYAEIYIGVIHMGGIDPDVHGYILSSDGEPLLIKAFVAFSKNEANADTYLLGRRDVFSAITLTFEANTAIVTPAGTASAATPPPTPPPPSAPSGSPSSDQPTGPVPTTWEIFCFSSQHLFTIPGNPAVGYPIPIPRPLPVDWAGDVIVGPNGQFYCTDTEKGEIVRFDPQTREPTSIFKSTDICPAYLAFDVNGNLLFSTYARHGENSGNSMGVWRIPEGTPGASAELIISGSQIRECGFLTSGCRFGAPAICVLTSGPYRGDILVSGRSGVPVSRAIGPDFNRLVPFLQDPGYALPPEEHQIPDALSFYHQVHATGSVMITDFINSRILEFDSEGRFVRIFASLYRANRLTSDYAGNVYASGSVWGRSNLQHVVGLSPNGDVLFQLPITNILGVLILET